MITLLIFILVCILFYFNTGISFTINKCNKLNNNKISFIHKITNRPNSGASIAIPSNKVYRIDYRIFSVNQNSQYENNFNENNVQSRLNLDYLILIVVLPILSFLFPVLLNQITDSNVSSSTRTFDIIALLLSKRVYLYSIGFVIIDIIVNRSINLPNSLTKRFKYINDEIISNIVSKNQTIEINKEMDIAYEAIDQIPLSGQVFGLPILLSLSLIISYIFLQNNSNNIINIFSMISMISTGLVCILFSNVEIKEFFKNYKVLDNYKDKISLLSSILLSAVAFISPFSSILWPIHNIINGFIAVTISRLFQLPKFLWIITLLTILVLYDVIFTNSQNVLVDNGKSIMEAIAIAKVTTSTNLPVNTPPIDSNIFNQLSLSNWKPGLFEVNINGRISDGLGLGDVVFPAILGGWTHRFNKNFYKTFVSGYVIGCLTCELFQTANGQPALLYIVPSIVISILLEGFRTNTIKEMFQYNDNNDETDNYSQ